MFPSASCKKCIRCHRLLVVSDWGFEEEAVGSGKVVAHSSEVRGCPHWLLKEPRFLEPTQALFLSAGCTIMI